MNCIKNATPISTIPNLYNALIKYFSSDKKTKCRCAIVSTVTFTEMNTTIETSRFFKEKL